MRHALPRLALLATLAPLAVTFAQAQHKGMSEADTKALYNHLLTTKHLAAATKATQDMLAALKKDPSLTKELRDSGGANPKDIDDAVRKIEEHPKAVAIYKAAGVSPRDYILTTYVVMQAQMVTAMGDKAPRSKWPTSLNPANVKFVKEHEPEVKSFVEATQELADQATGEE